MDLEKYDNFGKQDLVDLQKTPGGLIAYVRKGRRLPPPAFIQDARKQLIDFCSLDNTKVTRNAKHYDQHSRITAGISQ